MIDIAELVGKNVVVKAVAGIMQTKGILEKKEDDYSVFVAGGADSWGSA
jgi:hypothetical protein